MSLIFAANNIPYLFKTTDLPLSQFMSHIHLEHRNLVDRPCPGILKVNERKTDPEILGDAKWNLRSRGPGKIWRKRP
jgi:hypothetical protein